MLQATISVQNDIYTSNKAHNYGLQPISQKYKLLNLLKWFQCSPDWQWLHRTDIDPIVIQTFHCLYRWSTTLFHLFTHLITNMAVTCTWDQSINQSVLDHANWQQVSQLSALQPLRSILRRGILNVLYNYSQHHYQYHYFKQTCSEYETTPPPQIHASMHYACPHTHTHIHVHTYMSTHTHTSTHTHIYMYTLTQFTQTQNVRPTHPVVIGVSGANLDPSLVDSSDGVGADRVPQGAAWIRVCGGHLKDGSTYGAGWRRKGACW